MTILSDLEKYVLCCNQTISKAQKMQIEALARRYAEDTPFVYPCLGGEILVPRGPTEKDRERAMQAFGFFTNSEKQYLEAVLRNQGIL